MLGITILSSCSSDTRKKPDIVLITLDTTRWDFISSYGYPVQNSPQLDKLAALGSRYRNAVSVSGTTFPAHASMLSGLYPRQHGARSNFHKLGDGVTTVAQILDDYGYQTASFVSFKEMHRHGELDRGFETASDRAKDDSKDPIRPGDKTLKMTTDWLENSSATKPIFLWMHLFEPHGPYDITPWFRSNFPDYSGIFRSGVTQTQINNGRRNKYIQTDIEAMGHIYAGEIHLADQYVGTLINRLKLRGNLDNTLLIITSDHGQGMGESAEYGHGARLWESILRIPLIIVDFRNPISAVVDQRVGLIDVSPTILDAASIKVPTNMAGRSLYPLESPANGVDRLYYSEVKLTENPDTKTKRWYDPDETAVYLGELKLQQHKGKRQLFSTSILDNKLVRIPKNKAESLFYFPGDSITSHINNTGKAESAEIDPQTLKELQGLGYTQ